MPFTRFTFVCFLVAVAALLGALVAYVSAQALPQPAATSCEQRLEEAQNNLLEETKRKAQAEFRAAAIEQVTISLRKQLEAEQAKSKLSEKK